MKPRERPCKAVRRIISILHGKLHDRNITGNQFLSRKRHSALSYIFHNGISAQHTKPLVKIKRRHIDTVRHIIQSNVFCDMPFNKSNCFTDCFCPFHNDQPPCFQIYTCSSHLSRHCLFSFVVFLLSGIFLNFMSKIVMI